MPTEYDEMTGWGLLPAGLFCSLGNGWRGIISWLRIEMHPLWTITIKRPGLSGIVQSIYFSNGSEIIRANAEKISCHMVWKTV